MGYPHITKPGFLPGFIACGFLLISAVYLQAFEKRSAFKVPLANLVPSFEKNGTVDEVFVMFGNALEGCGISPINDRYVKDNSAERFEFLHKELPQSANLISPFEAEVLDKVCQSFVATLQIYERDLAGSKWDRLRYLDGYLVGFFRNFYLLFCATRNSTNALPHIVYIEDSLYASCSDSGKTDMRVAKWQNDPNRILQLRIASKELILQIKQWQKKELRNSKRDIEEDNSLNFKKAYELFVRLYLNIPPSSEKH